jgi:hypothetical protein
MLAQLGGENFPSGARVCGKRQICRGNGAKTSSGPKGLIDFEAFTARLKAVPFQGIEFFRSL